MVGAERRDTVDVEGEELAVGVHREAGLDDGVARLVVSEEPLLSRRKPAHWAAQHLRREQHCRVLWIAGGTHSERAADVARHHAQLVDRHTHPAGNVLAHREGALRGDLQHVAVGFGFVDGDAAARLHRRHDDALIDEPHSCDVGRAGEDAVDLGAVLGFPAIRVPVDRDIARRLGPNLRRLERGGAGDVGDGFARGVIDLYQLGRIACLRLAPGDDERDWVANMAHAVTGERGPVRRHHAGTARHRDRNGNRADAGRVESRGGQHREYPRGRLGGRSIDAANVGERVR